MLMGHKFCVTYAYSLEAYSNYNTEINLISLLYETMKPLPLVFLYNRARVVILKYFFQSASG